VTAGGTEGASGQDSGSGPGTVRVFAPATIGNVACGFDVMGLALESPGDEVVARIAEGSGIVSLKVTGDDGRLGSDPTRDCAALAGAAVLARLEVTEGDGPGYAGGRPVGVAMEVHKGLPLSSGMGGSAASAVGGAVAVNALLGGSLSEEELLACAMRGEAEGSGASHSDNVAPCLLGGIVLVPTGDPIRMVRLPVPPGLTAVVVHPHLEVETATARKLLGDTISLQAGTTQWGNTAGLVAGLYEEDWDLIARCLVDVVAEPLRSPLVQGFAEVKRAGVGAGALGVSLSGSGPSMFALCRGHTAGEEVGIAMVQAFHVAGGVAADLTVSAVGGPGARIRERSSD
jgi:homoserine kinase